jgi:hypothetical protein
VREIKPTLSLRGLQTVLTVATAQDALTYNSVSDATGQSYSSTSIQLALLSDGRGKQVGLDLIRRVPGEDRRQKKVLVTKGGAVIANHFLQNPENYTASPEDLAQLRQTVLPALRQVLSIAPDITLGTLCVLLYIVQHNVRFGLKGSPSVTISKVLRISNLPRHLTNLSTGTGSREGLGLVEMISGQGQDKRVVVPAPSGKGLKLVANVAATLQCKQPSPIKTPKPDRLAHDALIADMDSLEDDDFEFTEIEWMNDNVENIPPPQ